MNINRKKQWLILILLVFSVSVFAEVKIGVINADEVIRRTARGKEAIKRLESLGILKQKKIAEMRNEIKKLENDLLSPAVKSEVKQTKNLLLQDKQTKLNRYIQDSRREYELKFKTEMEKLQQEVMPVITRIGKSMGYTIIFDARVAGISYFEKKIDITDLVIKEYDSFSAKKSK